MVVAVAKLGRLPTPPLAAPTHSAETTIAEAESATVEPVEESKEIKEEPKHTKHKVKAVAVKTVTAGTASKCPMGCHDKLDMTSFPTADSASRFDKGIRILFELRLAKTVAGGGSTRHLILGDARLHALVRLAGLGAYVGGIAWSTVVHLPTAQARFNAHFDRDYTSMFLTQLGSLVAYAEATRIKDLPDIRRVAADVLEWMVDI